MRYTAQNLNELAWPGSRLEEAVEWLARTSGLVPVGVSIHDQPVAAAFASGQAGWQQSVESAAALLGIEAEPVSCTYATLEDFFRGAAPAIIQLPSGAPSDAHGTDPADAAQPVPSSQFIVIKKSGRNCHLLSSALKTVKVPAQTVADAFRAPIVAKYAAPADNLLDLAQIPAERRARVSNALVGSWLGGEILQVGWLLRPSPGASLPVLVRHFKILPEILKWLGTYALQNGLFLLAWWLIGRVIMDGQTDTVWVWAWALLLISIIPFQLATTWMQNRFSESLGVIFKQRLMYGALKMNPDDIRHLGAGQLLERVMDAESVETLVLSGGLSALISVFQLGIAAWVLAQGPGGGFSVAVLGLWVAAILVAGWINFRSGKRWTNAYRGMTNHMVEKMVGHRTRLAQEDPAHHHDDEDVELDEYQALSLNFSRTGMLLSAIPSSWVVAGLACLIPALTSSQAYRLPNMAIGLGGVMLAYQAFGVIQAGIQNTIMLLLSWEQAKPIFHAAADPETPAPIVPGAEAAQPNTPGTQDPQIPLIAVHDLSYHFAPNRPAALQNCRLEIYPGDRLILEGPSGSGKTTLGAVLAGLRQPDAGLLLLQGYDRFCLGEGAWRKRVVMAPQFHENHIFNETFAFNLLMGRRWPPQPQDLQDAAAICQELGLGDLLARMPSGWQQMVGENGWQLSHGERSRVFIARALLQNADMVIMDESFGALDPENLYLALDCARRRAATLLIIAHP